MKNDNILLVKSKALALQVVAIYESLKKHNNTIICNQLFKSGTAVGALQREAQFAESKKDFIHKLHISLKEANETLYWFELLHDTNQITISQFLQHSALVQENIKLLVSTIKTTKRNLSLKKK